MLVKFPRLGAVQMCPDHLRVVKLLQIRRGVTLCLLRLLLQLLPVKAGGVLERITALLVGIFVERKPDGPATSGMDGMTIGEVRMMTGEARIGRGKDVVVRVREIDRTQRLLIVVTAPTKVKVVARLRVRKVLKGIIAVERAFSRRLLRYPLSPSLVYLGWP